ncbi:MAG TPA: autotransporter domain-containing protein, partial [Lentisphaeria bacterium]|nr:autotransporter domain-containing protein [Lentisphaeria bacterium]
TTTLSGTNTYSGDTAIGAGTLEIGGTGTLQSGSYAGAIANTGTLHYNSSTDQELSGLISGSGALLKESASTLTLSGNNNYSGTTSVDDGTLLVNGTSSGGGSVNVASGATLGGTGTIGGTVTVASGGIFSPGTP